MNKKVKIVFYATDQTEAVFDGDTCIYQPNYTDNYKHYVSAVEWCKKNGYDYERVEV